MADAAGGASEVEDDASEAAALSEAALRALGLMVQFLKDGLLDSSVLPHARYEPLCAGGASGEVRCHGAPVMQGAGARGGGAGRPRFALRTSVPSAKRAASR